MSAEERVKQLEALLQKVVDDCDAQWSHKSESSDPENCYQPCAHTGLSAEVYDAVIEALGR